MVRLTSRTSVAGTWDVMDVGAIKLVVITSSASLVITPTSCVVVAA